MRLENVNFPVSPSGRASTSVLAKGAGYAVFSLHHTFLQLLNSCRKVREQINK